MLTEDQVVSSLDSRQPLIAFCRLVRPSATGASSCATPEAIATNLQPMPLLDVSTLLKAQPNHSPASIA